MKRFSLEHNESGFRWLLCEYTALTGTRLVGWGPWHDNRKDANDDLDDTVRGCDDVEAMK